MDSNVTTVFLSMALTIAFTRLVGMSSPGPGTEGWIIFFYFVARKISYYVADVQFNRLAVNVFKSETLIERMFNLYMGVITLFLFIVTGFYIIYSDLFFLLNALTLLVNIFWLILLLVLVDPTKDNNPKLKIRQMFKNFILVNISEIIICIVVGLWLREHWVIVNDVTFEIMRPWILFGGLSILAFIMLIDSFLHKEFLFNQSYSSSVV